MENLYKGKSFGERRLIFDAPAQGAENPLLAIDTHILNLSSCDAAERQVALDAIRSQCEELKNSLTPEQKEKLAWSGS